MRGSLEVVCGALAAAALAASASGDGDLPMPCSLDPSAGSFVTVRNLPFLAPELEYEIGVPAGWTEHTYLPDVKESHADPVSLGLWREGDGEDAAEIEVSYVVLPFTLHAALWLDGMARRVGFEVLARRHGPIAGRQVAELLGRLHSEEGEDEEPTILRLAAFVEAERLFLVTGSAPEDRYAPLAPMFAAAVLSFRTVSPVADPEIAVEPLALAGPFRVTGALPQGWRLRVGRRLPAGHLVAEIAPPDGEEWQFVRIHLAPAQPGRSESDSAEGALQVARSLGVEPEPEGIDVSVSRTDRLTGRLRLRPCTDGEREVRVFTLAGDAGCLTLSAVTPTHAEDAGAWRHWRAVLETMVDRLQVAP